MIVALDVGNTSLSMGGFQGEALIFHAKMATLLTWTEDQYAIAFRDLLTLHGADAQQIEGVILSSVVPGLTNTVKRAMGKLTDCAVLRSSGATCEEGAVLVFAGEEQAEAALSALKDYIQGQITSNQDYRPEEIPKLEAALVDRRGNTVLLAVASDQEAVQSALE